MADLVNDRATAVQPAVSLLRNALVSTDRLLLLGAGGWFGTTLRSVLEGTRRPTSLCIASKARINVSTGSTWQLEAWDTEKVRKFSPTIVVNFAFLTKERVAIEGEAHYREVNERLMAQFAEAIALPEVRGILTTSSGAAVTEPEHPYGEMKLEEERLAIDAASAVCGSVVARTYSVSGPYVRRPLDYAFSSFVYQALRGRITITASGPVYRRYVDAAEYLSVCLTQALEGRSGVVESGGELVELGDLAGRVARCIGTDVAVDRVRQLIGPDQIYASDNSSWTAACEDLDFAPMPIEGQIERVAGWMRNSAFRK